MKANKNIVVNYNFTNCMYSLFKPNTMNTKKKKEKSTLFSLFEFL